MDVPVSLCVSSECISQSKRATVVSSMNRMGLYGQEHCDEFQCKMWLWNVLQFCIQLSLFFTNMELSVCISVIVVKASSVSQLFLNFIVSSSVFVSFISVFIYMYCLGDQGYFSEEPLILFPHQP